MPRHGKSEAPCESSAGKDTQSRPSMIDPALMPNMGLPARANAWSGVTRSLSRSTCIPCSTSPPDTNTRSQSSRSARASLADARGDAVRTSCMRAPRVKSAVRIMPKKTALSPLAAPT